MRLVKYVLIFMMGLATFDVYSESIRYISTRGSSDAHSEYFEKMLMLSLDKTVSEYGPYEPAAINASMRQSRQFKSLEKGTLSVIWSVTSNEREERTLAIRIPLLKGLIGHRVLVIRKHDNPVFRSIYSIAQLANISGVQGHDWPDTKILEHAGLTVEKIVWHNSMYRLLSSGIVDYFPRSVLEVVDELKMANTTDLEISPYHLLVYPSALYFFVAKDNPKLAQRIEKGLLTAIEDGSFDDVFNNFPGHKEAMATILNKERRIFTLENPLIPDTVPLDNPKFWLQSTAK